MKLRAADSKYRLSYVLTRLAQLALRSGDLEGAARHAKEGLEVATDIRRALEMALAHVILARSATEASKASVTQHLSALNELSNDELGAGVRSRLQSCLAEQNGA